MSHIFCNLSVNGKLSEAVLETPVSTCSWLVHVNGSDKSFVDFGTGIGQFGTSDFTVAFWLQTSEQLRLFDLAGNRTASSNGNFLSIRMTGKHESLSEGVVIAEIDQDENHTNFIGLESNTAGLNDGNWHQIVLVRQSTSLKLYIDGELSDSGSAEGVANIDNDNPFKLGRSLVGNEAKFAPNAKYSDLHVYNVALTCHQVSSLFYSPESC